MYVKLLKPVLDKVFALILIIILAPLFVLVALLIYIKMGKPILFLQNRPGLKGGNFTIYKFRTMSDEKDQNGNLLPDEKRLHGVGLLIRSLSLDELPQLFNVLKGDMSFIGPRPLLCEYLELYDEEQKRRHDIKPGITGWAQVNGRNTISWDKKFKLDVWYVDNINCILDIKVLWMSFLKVLKRDGISQSNHVTMEKFKGNR